MSDYVGLAVAKDKSGDTIFLLRYPAFDPAIKPGDKVETKFEELTVIATENYFTDSEALHFILTATGFENINCVPRVRTLYKAKKMEYDDEPVSAGDLMDEGHW